jgi:hypothetical protein
VRIRNPRLVKFFIEEGDPRTLFRNLPFFLEAGAVTVENLLPPSQTLRLSMSVRRSAGSKA